MEKYTENAACVCERTGKSETVFSVPSVVVKIEAAAFAFDKNLERVVVACSVEEIGALCFDGCAALTSVVFPTNLDYVGELAFYGCKSLSSVTFTADGEWVLEKDYRKKILSVSDLNGDKEATANYFTGEYTLHTWSKNGRKETGDSGWTGFY